MSRIGLSFLPLLFRFPVPTCSAGCDSDLPEINFDDCNPTVNYSEIRRIFLAKRNAASFTNWTLSTEWLARMSATDLGDNAIRVLTVIGDKPAGAGVVKDISNGRRITIGKDHTLNFTIDDVSDENYEAMRQMECGGEYKMWYETEGEKLFGGNDGITVRVEVNNVLGRGRDEIEVITGVFSWRAKFHPERTDSPIFGTGNDIVVTSFNTTVSFGSTATPTAANGVTLAAGEVDAQQAFEYNSAPSIGGGTSQTMHIEVGGIHELTVSYLSGRTGDAFRYTDKAGTVHGTDTFESGTKNY